MFWHRLFLAFFVADAAACVPLTWLVAWVMHTRFVEAGLTLGLLEWGSVLLWALWGPGAFCLAVNMAKRTWSDPRQ